MDFPPLDDARWDRLLGAVVGQRPTVGEAGAPLAPSFPAPPITAWRDEDPRGDDPPGDVTIRLDSYA